MEKNRFVYFFLGKSFHLDHTLCNDSKVSFVTENEFVDIRTWTDSWTILIFLEGAHWSGYFDAYNDIIDISISIFFHPWSSSTDPSSKRTKLYWIWLMSTHDSKFGQLLFHIFSNNTRLDTGHHIILINPFDFIHSCHIYRGNASLLFRIKHQRLCDIGSSSKRNKNNLVLSCCLDQVLGLLVRSNIDDVVNTALKFRSTEKVELLNWVTVRVEYSSSFVSVYLIYFSF